VELTRDMSLQSELLAARLEHSLFPAGALRTDERAEWLRLPARSPQAAEVLAQELRALPGVEQAFVEPVSEVARQVQLPDLRDVAVHAGDRCPIDTPLFVKEQGYLDVAPGGIDAAAAWRREVTGQGVAFADIEGGWNARHEDLPGDRIEHVAGSPMSDRSWRAHGTAVLGEVVGKHNRIGVAGIAPGTERVVTASLEGIGVAAAIDAAASVLAPGDVLLIELQTTGPRGRWIPVELYDDVYLAIATHTARGVVIIEAAGNGAENLDHRVYRGKFDRANRDSGAIMVGAGGPPRVGYRDRERLDFSNYGARVDVQGWGRKVTTLDYGDLQSCSDTTDRHYTAEFSGTSSASPIVAGAAILLQSHAKRGGVVLTPSSVRALRGDRYAASREHERAHRTAAGPGGGPRRARRSLTVPRVSNSTVDRTRRAP
jgi:subtilisin family serine protease